MGANLFANIDPNLYGAIEAVSTLAGVSKKAVIESMIAERMHADHPHLTRVRSAWKKYRAGAR